MRRLVANPAIGICSFAIVVRVIYNITVARGYYPQHDSLKYQNIALNILTHHCYCLLPDSHVPTVYRAPLWPVVIAIIYGTVGSHNLFVRLFLCVVGASTCVLVYCFARDLFGTRIAVISGLVAAVYPFLYVYDGWLYAESLYTFLLFAFCYTLYHFQRTPRLHFMLLGGMLLGLISLTRPNGLLILGLFIVWAIGLGRAQILPWRVVAKSVVTISLISLAFVAPWTVRNYAVTHAFVPIEAGDGTVVLGAYNDKIVGKWYENGFYQGIWLPPQEALPNVAMHFSESCVGVCEVKRDNTYRYYAGQWIRSHLGSMPLLLELHFINIWQVTSQEADLATNRFPNKTVTRLVVTMMEVMTPIILALAACGLVVTRKQWRDLLFLYLVIMLTIVECLIFYGIPRFRAPLEPMLILLSAGAVWWITTLLHTRCLTKKMEVPATELVGARSKMGE